MDQQELMKIVRERLAHMNLSDSERRRYTTALEIEERNFTNQSFWDTLIDAYRAGRKSDNAKKYNLLYVYLLGMSDVDPMIPRMWRYLGVGTQPGIEFLFESGERQVVHPWSRVQSVQRDELVPAMTVKPDQVIVGAEGQPLTVVERRRLDDCDWKEEIVAGMNVTQDHGSLRVYAGRREWDKTFSNDIPDIDIDFPPWSRAALKEFVAREFGVNNVSSIANFNTFKLRSAIKDVARVYGVDYIEVNELSRKLDSLVNFGTGGDVTADDDEDDDVEWASACAQVPELEAFAQKYPEVIDVARRLIGRRCRLSVHASGVIISGVSLIDNMPLVTREKDGKRIICAGFSEGQGRSDCKTFGFGKFDFLGLLNLLFIGDTVEGRIKKRWVSVQTNAGSAMLRREAPVDVINADGSRTRVKAQQLRPGVQFVYGSQILTAQAAPESATGVCCLPGRDVSWEDKSYRNDLNALTLATMGATQAIFQFDSPLMQHTAKQLQPTSFDDMCAITTICRPGAMGLNAHISYIERKHGREEWLSKTPGPLLEVTSNTYGLPIYQEQIMLMLNKVGRIPLPDCEKIRKAMSQKKEEVFNRYREQFIVGAMQTCGWTRQQAEDYWGYIDDKGESGLMAWSRYGFNKSLVLSMVYVVTEEGDLKAMDECKSGDRIWSYDPQTNQPFIDEVVQLHENGTKEVFELELSNGATIQTTLDHEFMCEDGIKRRLYEIIAEDRKIMSMDLSLNLNVETGVQSNGKTGLARRRCKESDSSCKQRGGTRRVAKNRSKRNSKSAT